jgi:hypothetical protein
MLRKILTTFLLLTGLCFAQTSTFIPNGGVNAQTTSYAAQPGDVGKLITMNCAACTLTLPATPPYSQWTITVKNLNAGGLVIDPNGASLDGSASLVALASGNWIIITSNGNAYSSIASSPTTSVPSGTADLSLLPTSFDFGLVQQHVASNTTGSFVLTPNGTQPVIIGATTITGTNAGDFTSTNLQACAGPLASGASCPIQIVFTPATTGAESATLTVNSNSAEPVLTVALTGTGSATATFPLTVSFFGTGGGSSSDRSTFTCSDVAGTPTPNPCAQNYATGSTPTLTFTPATNSALSTVTGAGCSTSPCGPLTMNQARTVSVTFNLAPVTNILTVNCAASQGSGTIGSDLHDVLDGNQIAAVCTNGVLTGKSTGTFNQGSTITLTETPSGSCPGTCTFSGWGGGVSCSGTTCPVTLGANTTISAGFALPQAAAPLGLVQVIQGGTAGTNNVTGNFATKAQVAGDANIIGVVWSDNTTTISGVTDTSGNTYTQAATCSPQTIAGGSAAVYYSIGIAAAAAGANTVTVAMTASPSTRQILAGEYSGVTAFDVCHGATGTGTALNSGTTASTAAAGDLLFNLAHAIGTAVTVIAPNFIQQALKSGNDYEDRQGVAVGTYSATPTQGASNNWNDILVAFQANGSVPTTFSFNVFCGPSGSGSVTASGQTLTCTNGVPTGGINLAVAANSTQSLLATPAAGSVFVEYKGGGCGISPSCTTTAITQNTSIAANFALSGVLNYFMGGAGASDANDGLSATVTGGHGPWATFAHADAAMTLGAGGTKVNVASGSYAGGFSLNKSGTATARIQYVATGQVTSSMTFPAKITSGSISLNGGYTDINGFDITGPSSNYALAVFSVDGVHIIHNYIHDIGTSVCPGDGVISTFNNPIHFLVIDSNIIRHWGATTCGNVFHAIYDASDASIITNNVISAGAGGWAIKRDMNLGECNPGTISYNTIFNNNGGLNLTEQNGSGVFQCTMDYWNIVGNIIVDNGVSGTTTQHGGIDYYHFGQQGGSAATHNFISNNFLRGNLSGDLLNHDNPCGTSATGSTPVIGVPAQSNGAGSGCPIANSQTDAAGNGTTFANFVKDVNTAPIASGSFVVTNYTLKNGSNAINNGTTQCAVSPGQNPCAPTVDILGVARPQRNAWDIGAFDLQ